MRVRGTAQYNLQLGQQGAGAVAKDLRSPGVSEQQLSAVGHGEEQPLGKEKDAVLGEGPSSDGEASE
jgi:outer membrane protein OmpA-like peptidoglycan-associated protein